MSEDDDSLPIRRIPDWAIAKAYRRAVAKFDAEITRGAVLLFACDVTLDASNLLNEYEMASKDYAKDPLALAEWMRRHWRNDEGTLETNIPELHFIYEALIKAGQTAHQQANRRGD